MRKSCRTIARGVELRAGGVTGGRIKAAEEGNVDGHDDDGRRDLARRSAEGLGAAQRPGGAQGLHPGLRVAGENRRQRLRRRGQDQDRAGVGDLQRQGRTLRPHAARRLHHQGRGRGRHRRLRQGRSESVARRRPRRNAAALRRRGACRRQDRPARRAPHRRRRQEHGRQVFRQFRRHRGRRRRAGRRSRAGGAHPSRRPLRRSIAGPRPRRPPTARAQPAPQAIPTKTSWFRRISEWFMSLWR